MRKSLICKLATACAICCGVAFGIAIAPLVVAALLAVVALICLLGCVVIFLAGLFVWLFTIGKSTIFPFARAAANFGLGLFSYVKPVAAFSCNYITPIAGWVAVGVGVLGIVLAAIGIAKASKQSAQAVQGEQPFAPEPMQTYDAAGMMQPAPVSAKKAKKPKTEKGACIAALTVCIVFAVLSLIAVLVAAALVPSL